MALTTQQLQAIKADIAASPDMNTLPNNSDGAFEIARLYNLPSTTDVWRTNTPTKDVFDAITWANYTPNDVADGTTLYTNRMLAAQTKQMNLQNMLTGRDTVDTSKANIRAGLRDAVISLPTGTGGAIVTAGGVSGATVMAACVRKATRIEKLLASAPVATGSVSAGILSFEGSISYQDIEMAKAA
jgi:hypothetical protein